MTDSIRSSSSSRPDAWMLGTGRRSGSEQRGSTDARPGGRHHRRAQGGDRLLGGRRDRDVRLHRVRHGRGPLLRIRVLPELEPGGGHPGGLRHSRRRVRGSTHRRHHRRSPRRPRRPQAGPRRLAHRHGPGHVRHRPAADLRVGRRSRAGPSRHRPDHPGAGLRRRVGRSHPHGVRARTVAGQGPLHRHRPGRVPRGSAARQPRLPLQRPPRRHVGLAGAVPRELAPRRRRPRHPLQGPGVAGLRGGQGERNRRGVADQGRAALRLAQHPARHRVCGSRRPPGTPCRSPT